MKKILFTLILILCLAALSGCRKGNDRNTEPTGEIPAQTVETTTEPVTEAPETEEGTQPETESTEATEPSETEPEENPLDDPWSLGSFSEDDPDNEEQPAQNTTGEEGEPVEETTEATREPTEATEEAEEVPAETEEVPAETEEPTEENPWDAGDF